MNLQHLTALSISRELSPEQVSSLSESEFENLVLAYAEAEIKKFDNFAMKYKTNTEFQSIIRKLVLMSLQS